MKKTIINFLFILMLFFASSYGSLASNKVAEKPDINIIINSQQTYMQQKAISANGNILIPLRPTLVNLGISSDSKHLNWNPKSKTLHMVNNSVTIDLKASSKTTMVNRKPINLPIAPMIYKNTFYVPSKFISLCLNKKVVWLPSSKSIIIAEQASYNQVKKVLEKCSKVMEGVKNTEGKLKGTMRIGGSQQLFSIPVSFLGSFKSDSRNKKAYMNWNMSAMGQSLKIEQYIIDRTMYMYNNLQGKKWTKVNLTKDQLSQYNSLINLKDFFGEALFSSLKVDKVLSSKNQLVLSGQIISKVISDALNKATFLSNQKFSLKTISGKIYINRNSNYIEKLELIIKMQQTEPVKAGSKAQVSTASNMDFSVTIDSLKYNRNLTITLPLEAKGL